MRPELIEKTNSLCKDITVFKNMYAGQDIYVIGSGKSADYIHPSFFENKITIGINHVYKRFRTTFQLRKDEKLIDQIIKSNRDSIHIFSAGSYGNKNARMKQLIEKRPEKNLFYFDHEHNEIKVTYPKTVDGLIVSWSTITSGMHFAAYLGAKNIILVGHDCGLLDGQSNINNYHTSQTRAQSSQKGYDDWVTKIESQTLEVKKFLQNKYACNIYSLNPFINFGLEGHVYTR